MITTNGLKMNIIYKVFFSHFIQSYLPGTYNLNTFIDCIDHKVTNDMNRLIMMPFTRIDVVNAIK